MVAAVGILAAACHAFEDPPNPDLGGATTRADHTRNAFGLPAPNLETDDRRLFEVGDSFFTQNWVTAPASTEARDGLGPTFNAQACSSCHVLDGRGMPPDPAGEEARLGLLIRISLPGRDPVTGAPIPDPVYGGQIQDRAVLGVPVEGRFRVSYLTVRGTYGDGEPYELRQPVYELTELAYGDVPEDLLLGPRLAPQVVGMGLLEGIPEDELLRNADPDDENGDGISGRPNLVWDARRGQFVIGRFGWKANVATVEQQTAGAFHGDIGITSALHPLENCPPPQQGCRNAPTGGDPELTDSRLDAVSHYMRTLAVPAMRDSETEPVRAGARRFRELGCTACHTPSHKTGPSEVAVLSEQTIYPYTDLLLHEMGEGLADGRPDFEAGGSEWRTPPLWGIGLVDEINGERFLLHDGRARTLAEAILWHGGEAEASREAFRNADAEARTELLIFLEAL